jgi:hypothetical protein
MHSPGPETDGTPGRPADRPAAAEESEPPGAPVPASSRALPGSVEDVPVWYGFSLVLVALAPAPLVWAGAVAGAALGAHLLSAIARVRSAEAADDVSTARFFTIALALLAAGFRASAYWPLGLVWILSLQFFLNSVNNVRVMANLEARRRARASAPATPAPGPEHDGQPPPAA